MASRIVIRGRQAWASNAWRKRPPPELIDREKVAPVLGPILPRSVGTPFTDPDEHVTYRVVEYIDPRDGWCLASQLMKLYDTTYGGILKCVERGMIDGVMEKSSPTKRFRVRDSAKVRVFLAELKLLTIANQARKVKRSPIRR